MNAASRPPYLAHFRLREAPFSPGYDPHYFFADPEREQNLNLLLHLVQYSEEVLLVTGPAGVGKTEILSAFKERADEHLKLCHLAAAEGMDAGRLFALIAEGFGLKLSGGSDVLERLRQHLDGLHAQVLPVLMVDDAQRLSDDGIEVLLRLASLDGQHGKLLRLVLGAGPALRPRLEAARFKGMPQPHVLEVRPFDNAHTGLYLAHRLSQAGFSGANPFDDKAVQRIGKASGGLPREINILADKHMIGMMADRPAAWRTLPRAAYYGTGAVLAAVVAGAVILTGMPHSPSSPPPVPAPALPRTVPVVVKTSPAVVPTAANPVISMAAPESVTIKPGEVVRVMCAPVDAAAAPEKPAAAPAVPEAVPLKAQVSEPPIPPPVLPEPLAPKPIAKKEPEPVPVEKPPVATVTPANAPAINAAKPAKLGAESKSAVAAVSDTKLTPTPKDIPPVAEQPTSDTGLRDAQWVRARNPKHWTLQVAAASTAETVLLSVKGLRLEAAPAMVVVQRDGKPWHILLSGDFPDRASALAAEKKLPAPLRRIGAWTRDFASVQSQLPP